MGEINESEDNTRVHTPAQIRKIANSIRAHGNIVPIVVGEDDMILAGHGRLAAAKLFGHPLARHCETSFLETNDND